MLSVDRKTRQALLVTVCGVALFAALMNIGVIINLISKAYVLLLPIVIGLILAMFLNVPMNGYNRLLHIWCGRMKKKPSERTYHLTSFAFALISVLGVLVLVCMFVVPELVRSVASLVEIVEEKIPEWLAYLDERNINAVWLKETLSGFDTGISKTLTDGVGSILSAAVSMITATVTTTVTAVFALIIAVYTLIEKQKVCRHAGRLCSAVLKPKAADRVFRFCKMFSESFSKFLSGQTVEALILGVLIFLSFSVFSLPYATLIGVLTAVCALIPYIGAYISAITAVLLTVIVAPGRTLTCLIVYLVVQFVENQFIYPHVVGGSVGLSPLLTLVAALVGGQLFGIVGILFFIPLTAVICVLYDEMIENRLKKRKEEAEITNPPL